MMTSPTWRVVGASVQGTSHQAKDVPCQDAHIYDILPTGEVLIAVADGAGSAARSQEGADLAVKQAVAAVRDHLSQQPPADTAQWQLLMQQVFQHARQTLLEHAVEEDDSVRSFATTLMCAVLSHTTLVVGQLGDGVVVAEQEDGTLVTIIQPQRGEYANETSFLTQTDALDRVEVAVYTEAVQSLAVTTDGLLRLAVQLPDHTPSPRFFQPLLEFVVEAADDEHARHELAAFLDSERVGKRTDDDKTLVLAVRLHSGKPTETATEPREDT
jgi:serine/threonine protein phosphatase PrpC